MNSAGQCIVLCVSVLCVTNSQDFLGPLTVQWSASVLEGIANKSKAQFKKLQCGGKTNNSTQMILSQRVNSGSPKKPLEPPNFT